jgi:RNA 2',3'-cyclic 3'-phosphodiesterase
MRGPNDQREREPGSAQIRAFAAASLPPALLEAIREEQQTLARQCERETVRWTGAEQLHLTLRFYGNVPSGQLPALQEALGRAVTGLPALSLIAKGLGCFPSPQRPAVLWVGLEGDVAELIELQRRIELETAPFGSHSEERRFHPHLTIGRVKAAGPGARRVGDVIRATALGQLGSWPVNEITLVQSRLSPHGSRYTALAQFELGADATRA